MSAPPMEEPWIHPTAWIEEGVRIGPGTKIWDHVHVRRGARIGSSCILGEKTYVAYEVVIGDFCKINTSVYLCAGVVLGDFVMVAAHTVFTNDLLPRAGDPDRRVLLPSEPGPETLSTTVEDGVTIGANATIGPGVKLGRFAMVGMGAVVTRDVPPYHLVVGNPARPAGLVCVCGARLTGRGTVACRRCTRRYEIDGDGSVRRTDRRDA